MLTKIVNGKEVKCSAQEEAELLAEWDANDPVKNPKPKAPTLQDRVAALEAKVSPVNPGK